MSRKAPLVGILTALCIAAPAIAGKQTTHTIPWTGDWAQAVQRVQQAYPGSAAWLLACSASEGGHGGFVYNRQGSGAGGQMQFLEGTFWRMYAAAQADLAVRGYRIPASTASWYSPLGQAIAAAWGYTHGRRGEWYGAGC